MRRRNTIIILLVLAFALLLLAGRESYTLFHSLRHISAPTHETREPFGHGVHGWMTVEEVAKYYHVSTADVFAALNISPAPGDDKLSLKDLGNKYHMTAPDMENALNKLNTSSSGLETDRHG
jgi:hypothetical protein